MTTYATIEQYDARFPGRTASDGTLTACLEDATAAIDATLAERGIDPATMGEDMADRCMRVCRSVANRILPQAGADMPPGVTSASISAVGFQQTYSFGATYATPRLLPSELYMLGLGRAGVGWAPLGGHDDGA